MSRPGRVLILGGGLAGLSFAIAIASENPELELTLLEAHAHKASSPKPLDTRGSALNLHSVALLEQWGVWHHIASCSGAIREIHVSHRGHFGSTLMKAEDLSVPALGYVAENHELGTHLLNRARELGVAVRAPIRCKTIDVTAIHPSVVTGEGEQLTADLVLIAAGVERDWFHALGIGLKERPVGTHAVVFNASFPGEQRGRAFERFTANGPLAVLPLPSTRRDEQRYNVVWSVPDQDVDTLAAMPEDLFRAQFQEAFGWRLGPVRATGQRSQWPLMSRVATEQFRSGFLLVGNAAHTLHPVAGQGLNLSLREAASLAKVLASCRDDDTPIGQPGFLSSYLDEVTTEQHFVTQSTDTLATLFNRRGLVMDGPRNVSLALLDFMPSMRTRVASIGTGRRYA